MSKPKYRWWGFVRRMIRDYPSLKQQWEDIHEQTITADISGMPRGGSASRTVETIALRQLPDDDDQKAFDAVSKAIEITSLKPTGEERLTLIKFMYWSKKNLTAKGAAAHIHVEYITAKRWHGDFVRLVGKCHGFKLSSEKR